MEELMNKVWKLQEMPYVGKPLENRLASYRSVRVKGKYRLVHMVNEEENEIILVAFGHRKEIYKFMMFLQDG
jgi:addiction module RelE/StbE family toxin